MPQAGVRRNELALYFADIGGSLFPLEYRLRIGKCVTSLDECFIRNRNDPVLIIVENEAGSRK